MSAPPSSGFASAPETALILSTCTPASRQRGSSAIYGRARRHAGVPARQNGGLILCSFPHGAVNRAEEVHFTGKTLDGAVFVSSRENGTPVTFTLTQENVIEGFIVAISTMQPGEKAVFTMSPEFGVTESGCPASIPWNIPPNQTLRFDVELISLITDVLEDQGILKKTVMWGSGKDYPGDFDEVFVKYTACLKDGTSVATSEGVEFSLAEGFFCPAFAHALKTMTEGEGALLIIKPKYGFGEQGRPAIGNESPVPPDATLHVNLQLISWITVSCIGENQEILKRAPHQAKYSPRKQAIRNQAVVKVRLIGKLEDGTVFDRRGHDGDEPFEFTIDEEHVIHSLDEAVLTMKEGEAASFTIPPQYAFGADGSDQFQLAVVPANSVVIYEIEVLTVDNGKNSWHMTRKECIKSAHRKEKVGDKLFKLKKYMRAYRRYYMASQVLRSQRDDDEITQIIISCLLKCAECAVQVQRYEQAADRYREVLEYDGGNAKAQRAMAQPLPKASHRIDTVAMHVGLELEDWGGFCESFCSLSPMRKVRMPGSRTTFLAEDESHPVPTAGSIPRVARPAEDARHPVPAAPAAPTPFENPATSSSATPRVAGGDHDRATPTSNENQQASSAIKALVSWFGFSRPSRAN